MASWKIAAFILLFTSANKVSWKKKRQYDIKKGDNYQCAIATWKPYSHFKGIFMRITFVVPLDEE